LTNDFLSADKRPKDARGLLKRAGSNSSIDSEGSGNSADKLEELMQAEYNWDGCDRMDRMHFRFWDTFKSRYTSIAAMLQNL
jgi:hypothetical protein